MPTLPAGDYYAAIQARTGTLAAIVDRTDPALQIPACPGWTLRNLATHVGRAQRWAAEITAARSATFIDFAAVPDGRLPAEQAARGPWLVAGAGRLIAALLEAGEDDVWAFNRTAPASFWARRMAHETTVHCADAQLAAGDEVCIEPELAADAIDEWLTTMSGPLPMRQDRRLDALPLGRSLHVHATDAALGGAGEWLVRHASQGGIQVLSGHAKADVALAGPAAEVLLVLLRRRPVSGTVNVFGDRSLLDRWLEHTEF
jgi:uncharacterized protein (TIGR03083 family)